MPNPNTIYKPFNSYKINYAITNPNGKDYVRIDFFNNGKKVGQVLMGDAVVPGSYANLISDEIHLYFKRSHFYNIAEILRQESGLALYIESDNNDHPIGGIVTGQ